MDDSKCKKEVVLCTASFLRVVKLPDKQMVSKCLGSMSDPTAAMAACSNEPELKSTEALLFTRNRYRTHTSHLPGLSSKPSPVAFCGCGTNLRVLTASEVFGLCVYHALMGQCKPPAWAAFYDLLFLFFFCDHTDIDFFVFRSLRTAWSMDIK